MAARFVRYPVFGIAHRAVKGRTPTKEEKKWMDFICQQGCIVCQNEIGVFSPCEPHHMEGKTQAGAHFMTIPLCWNHHRSGINTTECVSRHPHKTEFEQRYGRETDLLEQVKELQDG